MASANIKYAGHRIPSPAHRIARIDLASLDAHTFHTRYVATRTPVVIRGHPDELRAAVAGVTGSGLVDAAGDVEVEVEVGSLSSPSASASTASPAAGAQRAFGHGVRETMRVRDVVARLQAGAAHYVSTQSADASWTHTSLPPPPGRIHLSAPLPALVHAFGLPLRPALAGALVPQSVHMWMGLSVDGSSSGLHHDFHDNIYVLAQGRKRFTLFDPAAAPHMRTYGELASVAPNGRINYVGAPPVDDNGVELAERAAWESRRAADEAEDDDDIDDALDRMLAAATGKRRRSGAKKKRRPPANTRVELPFAPASGDNDDDDADFDMDAVFESAAFDMAEFADDDDDTAGVQADNPEPGAAPASEPDHFSQLSPDDIARVAAHSAVAELEAGDMLFLPAGWFHEVTSFSPGPSDVHIAFNYWFHPASLNSPPDAPYATAYWPDVVAAAHPGVFPPPHPPKRAKGLGTKR